MIDIVGITHRTFCADAATDEGSLCIAARDAVLLSSTVQVVDESHNSKLALMRRRQTATQLVCAVYRC
jgi:hypothetical protein